MNILFKTTTNRSPGDDLAFRGAKILINQTSSVNNFFLYDVGKDMRPLVNRLISEGKELQTDLWHKKRDINIDLVVIAGTPVWGGEEIAELEDFILKTKTPVIYLGVGTPQGGKKTKEILQKYCKCFIARDKEAKQRASFLGYKGITICCPSIFAVDKSYSKGDITGIVVQANYEFDKQVNFIKKHNPRETVLIAHHIEDYEAFSSLSYKMFYSRWIEDLIKYYSLCKEIYSVRVHGAHLAFGMNIPTVCIKTVKKASCCDSLGIKIKQMNKASQEDLVRGNYIKDKKWEEYLKVIKGVN